MNTIKKIYLALIAFATVVAVQVAGLLPASAATTTHWSAWRTCITGTGQNWQVRTHFVSYGTTKYKTDGYDIRNASGQTPPSVGKVKETWRDLNSSLVQTTVDSGFTMVSPDNVHVTVNLSDYTGLANPAFDITLYRTDDVTKICTATMYP